MMIEQNSTGEESLRMDKKEQLTVVKKALSPPFLFLVAPHSFLFFLVYL